MTCVPAVRMLIAVVCVLVLGLETGQQYGGAEAASKNVTALAVERESRSTLRVGMWTLWHDRQLTLAPASSATLRTCARCSAHSLRQGLALHAVGNSVAGASPFPLPVLLIDGVVTLATGWECRA